MVAFAVFWFLWSAYAVAQRTDDLAPRVVALARAQEITGDGPGAAALNERLFRVEAGLIGARLFVADESGTVLRSSADTNLAALPLDRLEAPDSEGVRAGTLSTTGASGSLLVVAAPMNGSETLVAVQSLAEVRDAQRGILTIAFVTVLVGIAVAWVAGGLLAGRLTGPLRRLEAAAERVAAGEWGTLVAEEGDAETASLARSFNRMSTRVAAAYETQKEFIGDVSHEIRTPLTSIRGFTEALLDGTVTEPAQRERALGAIKEESIRLTELAQTLLALAELDAGRVEVRSDPVDTQVLADALRGRFATAAEARGIGLRIDLSASKPPLADLDRLIQAASTLVANAVAYPPPGSDVVVHARVDGHSWLLLVDDSGPGIPMDQRERLFERFARLDSSRSSGSGGTGLGLSICRRLVTLMGGSVDLSDSPSGGARFTIRLPAADTTQQKRNTEAT